VSLGCRWCWYYCAQEYYRGHGPYLSQCGMRHLYHDQDRHQYDLGCAHNFEVYNDAVMWFPTCVMTPRFKRWVPATVPIGDEADSPCLHIDTVGPIPSPLASDDTSRSLFEIRAPSVLACRGLGLVLDGHILLARKSYITLDCSQSPTVDCY